MFEAIRAVIYKIYTAKDYGGEDEFSRFLLATVGVMFALVLHIMLLVIFSIIGISQLIVLNSVSIVCYLVGIWLVTRRRYDLAGLILSIEVPLYVFCSVALLGSDIEIYLYHFIVAIALIVFPYYRKASMRACMAGFVWLTMLATWVFDLYSEPAIDFSRYANFMAIINMSTAMIAVIIELLVVNSVHNLVASFHELRINELEDQVNIDPLTKLYNRRYAEVFFATLDSDPLRTPYFVAIADIDDFKLVNDRYGHDVGDEVLKALAELMTSTLRSSDTVFRWGGEEFLIVLSSASLEKAHTVLEKLLIRIAETPTIVGSLTLSCTMTMGLAPLDIHGIRESIIACDKNLYIGKRSGKNKVVS